MQGQNAPLRGLRVAKPAGLAGGNPSGNRDIAERRAHRLGRKRQDIGGLIDPPVLPVETPDGRVQVASGTRFTRGTLFMGLEIARLLDEQEEKDRAKR